MFGHAITFGRDEVVITFGWQIHQVPHIGGCETLVDKPHRLIPDELQGVAIFSHPFGNLGRPRHRRTMGGHQVLGLQRQQVVNPADEHLRVAILLASNGENVEKHRPDQVVHGHAEAFEPESHRIVGIRGRMSDFDGQSGHFYGG